MNQGSPSPEGPYAKVRIQIVKILSLVKENTLENEFIVPIIGVIRENLNQIPATGETTICQFQLIQSRRKGSLFRGVDEEYYQIFRGLR